ncbi:MAG: extracellular solute-binding protein [Oscillospiraceae bacterium]|nr:extracellular solute-binding protein [Oscillospiraceae bacterium]
MKSVLKRIVTFGLAAAIATSVTGCATSNQSSSSDVASEKKSGSKTVITLGMHVANVDEQEPVTGKIIKAFEQANPNITVQIQGNDKDAHVNKMKLDAQSGELPDIFWMDSSVAPQLNSSGVLLDLSDFLKAYPAVNTALSENMKAASRSSDGKQYGLPYQSLVTGFWYNKAVFKRVGIDAPKNGTTYDELIKMVKALHTKGIIPIAQGAKDAYSVWGFLTGLERYGYFSKIDSILNGKAKFDNPDFLKYFSKINTLGKAGAFPSNCATSTYFQAKADFTSGKAAMFDSGVWDAGVLDKSIGKNIGFWWGPTFQDSSDNQKVSMNVSSAPFCVSKAVGDNQSKKDAVYKFLAFYYSKQAAKISYEGSIIPATNYKVDANLESKPAFKAVVTALQESGWSSPKAQPDLVLTEAVQAQLYDSIYGTMLGTYSPKEALEKIDSVQQQQ